MRCDANDRVKIFDPPARLRELEEADARRDEAARADVDAIPII